MLKSMSCIAIQEPDPHCSRNVNDVEKADGEDGSR